LLERYGQYSQYVGNPDLEVEKDWTGILGWEMNESAWEVDLQLYGQIRNDTIPSFGTPSAGSLGRAVVGSFLHTVRHRLSDQFSIREAGALSGSEVSRTQVGFPYLPAYAQSLALEAADRIEDPKWKASLVARAQTRVVAPVVNPATYGTDPVAELPGWAYFDLTGQFELFQGGKGSWIEKLDLFAQLENLFDRGIEFQRDYPGKGRTVSAGVTGQF
jgi:outer membrane cobalamin receptor